VERGNALLLLRRRWHDAPVVACPLDRVLVRFEPQGVCWFSPIRTRSCPLASCM